VAPPHELQAVTEALVAPILECAPTAVRLQKELIIRWRNTDQRTAIEYGINALAQAYATGEPREAMQAFLPIIERVAAGRLAGAARIGLAVGKVIDRHKVAKHFEVTITDDRLTIARDEAAIIEEAALDGLYILRTSVPAERLASADVVRSYKLLTRVERAFRSFKAVDLQVRPIHHWTEPRVRAHVFLCLLAYYVEWHLERAWAPLLFRDEERPELADPVAPAQRSAAALRKAHTKELPDGTPVHSFRTLLAELATLTRNRVLAPGAPEAAAFEITSTPTPLQSRALALLNLTPATV